MEDEDARMPHVLDPRTGRPIAGLRSATVIGFFGSFGAPPTLGVRIKEAFGATDYGEAWTHLWMLVILVVVFDWWSGAVRRRLVG